MKTPHKHAEDNSANKKKPHIHAELIKQWADGATIQWYNNITGGWEPAYCGKPSWDETTQYRVKPEPKPDVVEVRKFSYDQNFGVINEYCVPPNIQLIFDGETGALKDCQILAKE